MMGMTANVRFTEDNPDPLFSEGGHMRPMGLDFSLGSEGWIAEGCSITKYRQLGNGNFIPIASYYTGYTDSHELITTKNNIPIFNHTRNDCLATINAKGFVKTAYVPKFVNEENKFQDRFHINGIATDSDGKVKYISCFSTIDRGETKGWKHGYNEGTIWDVENEVPYITGQNLPHSPRIYDGTLHWCNSGEGQVHREDGKYIRTGVFTRGMRRFGDYLFVGGSVTRNSSNKVNTLKMTQNMTQIIILDFASLKVLDRIIFEDFNTEIFDFWLFPHDQLIIPAKSPAYKSIRIANE